MQPTKGEVVAPLDTKTAQRAVDEIFSGTSMKLEEKMQLLREVAREAPALAQSAAGTLRADLMSQYQQAVAKGGGDVSNKVRGSEAAARAMLRHETGGGKQSPEAQRLSKMINQLDKLIANTDPMNSQPAGLTPAKFP